MEFLKEWTYCVCISLIIAVIFSLFAPKGRMNRFYKIMISVFVFLSFVYPLRDINPRSFVLAFDSSSVFEETEEPYENMINGEIKRLLGEKNIKGAVVESTVKMRENAEIEITDVQVAIPHEYSKDEVQRLIFDGLKINARVIYLGE